MDMFIQEMWSNIENQFISARPFYGETVIEKIRHALIEICKYLMPKRHQYMLRAFSLKKGKINGRSIYSN